MSDHIHRKFGISRLIAGFLLLVIANSVYAESYDLVILKGRVMDPETGYDAIANVGINNGKIDLSISCKYYWLDPFNIQKTIYNKSN